MIKLAMRTSIYIINNFLVDLVERHCYWSINYKIVNLILIMKFSVLIYFSLLLFYSKLMSLVYNRKK